MSKKENCAHRTSIGGQAVIEGIMMRGPKHLVTAVRKTDGEIVTDKKDVPKSRSNFFFKLPIIRGCIGFFDSMVLGTKALMFSASFFDLEDDEEAPKKEPGKFGAWLDKKLSSDKAITTVMYISMFFSLIVGIGLFFLLPWAISEFFLEPFVEHQVLRRLAEGVVRIIIFVAYLALVSQMKDIKRVFMYHGAEHKAIACYEANEELTVENVRKHSRFHPRCGTSFLLIVMVVSILVFGFIPAANRWMAMGLRLALLPVVAGLSYEIIKFAGRHSNFITRGISAPGKSLQAITTREPDDSQIEVAITALTAVMPENKDEAKW